MMNIKIIGNIFYFVILILIQVFVLNKITIWHDIIPYFYIIFVLTMPFKTPGWALIFISFILGLIIDFFTDTVGINAGATSLIAFIRLILLRNIIYIDKNINSNSPNINSLGLFYFLQYSFILIIIHRIYIQSVELLLFSDTFKFMVDVIIGSIFTLCLIILMQLFGNKTGK